MLPIGAEEWRRIGLCSWHLTSDGRAGPWRVPGPLQLRGDHGRSQTSTSSAVQQPSTRRRRRQRPDRQDDRCSFTAEELPVAMPAVGDTVEEDHHPRAMRWRRASAQTGFLRAGTWRSTPSPGASPACPTPFRQSTPTREPAGSRSTGAVAALRRPCATLASGPADPERRMADTAVATLFGEAERGAPCGRAGGRDRDDAAPAVHRGRPAEGRFVFVADLVRALDRAGRRPRVEFLRVSSYGRSHQLRLVNLIGDVPAGSGASPSSWSTTSRTPAGRSPSPGRCCRARRLQRLDLPLLDKPSRRVQAGEADFIGFVIPDVFVVGYGIDYAERYRELPLSAR